MGQDRDAAHPCLLEQQGQMRTSRLVYLLPSSSSESPACTFLLLSNCSWSRARQNWGQQVLQHLQKGEAGSDLKVSCLGGPRDSCLAEPCPPHTAPGKEAPGLQWQPPTTGTAPGTHASCSEPSGSPLLYSCHGHRHWCIKHQGPSGLRLLFGCPGLSARTRAWEERQLGSEGLTWA